jgi:hypothetical protein
LQVAMSAKPMYCRVAASRNVCEANVYYTVPLTSCTSCTMRPCGRNWFYRTRRLVRRRRLKVCLHDAMGSPSSHFQWW